MLFALSHAAFLKLNKNFHCPRRVAGEEVVEIGRKKNVAREGFEQCCCILIKTAIHLP